MRGEAERLRKLKETQRLEKEALEARRAEQERRARQEEEQQQALVEAEQLRLLKEQAEEDERIRLLQEEEARNQRRLREASQAKEREAAQAKSRMRSNTVRREPARPTTSKGSPATSRPPTSSQQSPPHASPSKLGFWSKRNRAETLKAREDALAALEDRPKTAITRPREISASSGEKKAAQPVPGFDAPKSAVNAGDRVSYFSLKKIIVLTDYVASHGGVQWLSNPSTCCS
jgi:hypothetical protein